MEIIDINDIINDLTFNINDWYGYVYMTTDLSTGRKYLGKKNFFHKTNKKLGKKEIAALPITRGRPATTKEVIKESDWKTYYGSADEIKKIKDKSQLTRHVLRLCKHSKELTYFECKYQFSYGVLENPETWINDNIQGRFFSTDFIVKD